MKVQVRNEGVRIKLKAVLAQSAFKKHMCFFLTSCFFIYFFVLFLALKCFFFPDFREIMIKMVIFIHFKYFKRNISELSLR